MGKNKNKNSVFKNLYFRDLHYIFNKKLVLEELIRKVENKTLERNTWFGWISI